MRLAVVFIAATSEPASGSVMAKRPMDSPLNNPGRYFFYSHLFARPDPGAGGDIFADLNPDSLETLTGCRLEPALASVPPGEPVQFERLGYFCSDPESTPGRPLFNRTVGLRDSWAKAQAAGG